MRKRGERARIVNIKRMDLIKDKANRKTNQNKHNRLTDRRKKKTKLATETETDRERARERERERERWYLVFSQ